MYIIYVVSIVLTALGTSDPFDPSGLMCVHGHALIPECFRTIENFAKTSEPGYCNEAVRSMMLVRI